MTDKNNQIKQAIANYIEQYGVTSTRDIAEGVASELGFSPSTATVAKVLRDMGYLPKDAPTAWWKKAK